MPDPFWLVTLAAIVFAAIPIAGGRRFDKRVETFARRANLDLQGESQARVRARLLSHDRAAFAGGLLGLAGAVVAVSTMTGSASSSSAPAVIGLILGGMVVGVSVAAVRQVASLPSGGPRAARLSRPTIGDYVPGYERWGARLAVGLAVLSIVALPICAAAGVFVDADVTGVIVSSAGMSVLIAVVSLVVAELLGQRFAGMRQEAASPAELAWQDALRAIALREIVTAPLMLGLVSTLLVLTRSSGLTVHGPLGDLLAILGGVVVIVVLAMLVLVPVSMTAERPMRHYQRRLWSKVPA